MTCVFTVTWPRTDFLQHLKPIITLKSLVNTVHWDNQEIDTVALIPRHISCRAFFIAKYNWESILTSLKARAPASLNAYNMRNVNVIHLILVLSKIDIFVLSARALYEPRLTSKHSFPLLQTNKGAKNNSRKILGSRNTAILDLK